jgi:hypothetical protein
MQSVPITTNVCEFESWSGLGVQNYVMKFVSDLRQVGGFLRPPVSSTNKTDRHDITEILLKVVLNTIKQTNKQTNVLLRYLIYLFDIFQLFPVAGYECLMPLSSASHQRPKSRIVLAQIKWR